MAAEARPTASARPRVVLGVGGGIAAYKACELLRRLTESGHDVTVVPTASALRFVGAPTWEALSGHPVSAEVRERRLAAARDELAAEHEFDTTLVNTSVEDVARELLTLMGVG